MKRIQNIYIIGAGIAGLLSAIELRKRFSEYSVPLENIYLIESRRVGGEPSDQLASGVRCQGWLHGGELYAYTQSVPALRIKHSAQLFRELCPEAFEPKIALSILRESDHEVPYEQHCRLLGIRFERVTHKVATRIAPSLSSSLGEGDTVYANDSCLFSLRLVNARLRSLAGKAGVKFVHATASDLQKVGGHVTRIGLGDDGQIQVGPQDVVVLACSNRIPKVLHRLGVDTPIRSFQSQLAAVVGLTQDVMLSSVLGGPTVVPHRIGQELMTVLGNAKRFEIDPESHPDVDDDLTAGILQECESHFGISVDVATVRAWVGVKAEAIHDGNQHSQDEFVMQAHPIQNVFVLLPGKLTNAPFAARDLANMLVSPYLDVGQSIWTATDLADTALRESLQIRP